MKTPNPQAGARTSMPGIDGADALTLALVRHGPTAATVAGKISGGDELGPPLTEFGLQMATNAAAVVARIPEIWPGTPAVSEVIASPMTRAHQTGEAIASRLGLGVEVREGFREAEFGAWNELTVADIDARWDGGFSRYHYTGLVAPPEGESYIAVAARTRAEVERLRAEGYGRTVAIAGHTVMIRTVLGTTLGMPPSHWGRFCIPACSLSIVQFWPDHEEVLAVAYPTC